MAVGRPVAWIAAVVGTAALAAVAVLGVVGATPDGEAEATADTRAAASPSPTPANPFAAGGLQDPVAAAPVSGAGRPVAIRIPSLGVESSLENLTLGEHGQLLAPMDFDVAGWFMDGPAPGEIGPAIIAGHVDSYAGPAIFYRLSELADGEQVIIETETGASLTFTITGRMQSANATFPTSDVYSNVPRAELRLITCAGYFDRSIRRYTDNLILFATLTT